VGGAGVEGPASACTCVGGGVVVFGGMDAVGIFYFLAAIVSALFWLEASAKLINNSI
jgi:hypothetical protein